MTETVSKRVLDKLDKIDENITELKTKIASIETKLEAQPELDESKHGAIDEKVKRLDDRVLNLEKNQRWVIVVILGFFIEAVLRIVIK